MMVIWLPPVSKIPWKTVRLPLSASEKKQLKVVYVHDRFVEFRPLNISYESIIKMGDDLEDVAIEGLAIGYWHTL